MKEIKRALITGASKGLGFAYVKQLLQLNYSIVAVARNCDEVAKLQTKYPYVEIICWNLDLSKEQDLNELIIRCANYNFDLIINNAGFGLYGRFETINIDDELNMIDLNIKAVQKITKYFYKRFINVNQGRIINVSSIAGYIAQPLFDAYSASKAYVSSLSKSLNTYLKVKKLNVRVIEIAPGPLITNFWDNLGSNMQIKGMSVEIFANKSLTKALKTNKKNTIVIGFKNKLFLKLLKIGPENYFLKKALAYQMAKSNKK